MPSPEDIKQRIETAIPGAHADVEDYTGDGDHFRATVTAPAFDGLSRIEQHRLVYEVFGAEIGGADPRPRAEDPDPVEDSHQLTARSPPCPASQIPFR